MVKFSVLLCTYAKDNPEQLAQSINSTLEQTVLPNEWVIVKDGKLPEESDAVIRGFSPPGALRVVALPKNVTLGPARMAGLKTASHEWVALVDADDVCLPDRFEKQLALINADPELCIVGGQIIEFEEIPGTALAARNVPICHAEILKCAKKRNPFSAMTVMFHREKALDAGGFRYHPGFEDYDLWTRMIANGARCANHSDVLVHVRAGKNMYSRRRGLKYIRSEWRMQRNLKKLGINNLFEFIGNIFLRIPVRLLPAEILGRIYERFARK
ncbi:MAG: glycosyltransferase [Defluviitaleaceae bacterium]|nr:glycosyltransferase [Defluviitaleaceae bacterium]